MFELFIPLKNKQYRLFFAAHSIALLGTGLSTIALALFAYNLDNARAAEIVSFALGAKMIAYIFIAPIIGGYAHKLPRKQLMIFFDIFRAILLFSLPWASDAWHIYIIIFFINACSAGFTPLYQATLPNIFNNEADYTRALSLSRSLYDLENLLSPAIAAILLLGFGHLALFQVNSAAFIVSAIILSLVIYPSDPLSDRQSGIWHNVSFGIKSYLKTPRLRGVLSFNFIAALTGALIIVNSANFAHNIYGKAEIITALLFGSVGVGAIIMSFLMPHILKKYSIKQTMLWGSILAITALLFFVITASLFSLFLTWFMLGMVSSLLQTPSGIVIQKSSRKADRAAYFSAQFTLTHVGWLIAYLVAGQLGSYVSISINMIILAVISAMVLLLALKFWSGTDELSLKHSHDEHSHDHPHIHDKHHQHSHEGWEGPEPHIHPHHHDKTEHVHEFYIDEHHLQWPNK